MSGIERLRELNAARRHSLIGPDDIFLDEPFWDYVADALAALEAAEADVRQKETHARNRERELLILFSEAEARAEAAEADARQYREAVEAIVAAFRGIRVNEITDEDIGRNRGTQHGALLLAYRALGRA